MSVIIKGVDMPHKCLHCKFCMYKELLFQTCLILNEVIHNMYRKNPRCPLVEVPTPHGRLIDADDIGSITVCHNMSGYLSKIEAPTIIEAEEVSK